ncbi:hypothetical protein SAMN05216207_1016140 [Pseudonocardia ammonioxydans]|uniref:Uncharacterized protein n=1 Tax=Pseudonocardia ammonioxydans TaxID=260086 RepID=A0A1I5A1W4_PSUAM|nr:hypothetical protein [Pseudonocardia ammonioxydans]SFN56482.1 hypothetical protein SAMN05216207_1016140 [Pseudonocardia ammonioxydans]
MGMTTVVVILVVLALVLAVRGVVREGSGGLRRAIEVWRRAARGRGRGDAVVRARPHLGAAGTKAPLPAVDGKVRCLLIGSELRP